MWSYQRKCGQARFPTEKGKINSTHAAPVKLGNSVFSVLCLNKSGIQVIEKTEGWLLVTMINKMHFSSTNYEVTHGAIVAFTTAVA